MINAFKASFEQLLWKFIQIVAEQFRELEQDFESASITFNGGIDLHGPRCY